MENIQVSFAEGYIQHADHQFAGLQAEGCKQTKQQYQHRVVLEGPVERFQVKSVVSSGESVIIALLILWTDKRHWAIPEKIVKLESGAWYS